MISAQLALLPAIQAGQAQLACDSSSLVTTLEAQKEATAGLTRQFAALSARVAALEKGPSKNADADAASSDDAEVATQRSKFARSAAGKARPRSSSPAPATSHRDSHTRAASAPSRPSSPPTAASSSSPTSAEELDLIRLGGLTTRSMANKAWQTISASLPAGTPAPVEIVTLAVHDYITLKLRDRDTADSAYRALAAYPMVYKSSKGKELKASAIRVKPPAVRRRGVALSPFCKAIEDDFPNVEITQKHRTKGRASAATFLVECAAEDADEFISVATVMWRDTGSEVVITEVEVDDATPPDLAETLRRLVAKLERVGKYYGHSDVVLVQEARGGRGVEAELRYYCGSAHVCSSACDRPEAGGLVSAVRPEFNSRF